MKVINELSLLNFKAWSGAIDTRSVIVENNKVKEFDNLIETMYPEGITACQLNDYLWFNNDSIYSYLGIEQEN
jgi:hypothetical protein